MANCDQFAASVSGVSLQRHFENMDFQRNLALTNELTLMQLNGRIVLSPPNDWRGPPPGTACELYIRHIPRCLSAQKLMQPFLRFGRIYEMRLPMDFNQGNRGYAYVKYTNEEDAACAMEVLSHYFVGARRKLEILHSYEKCRLFVTNIPRHLSEAEIEMKFREIFPAMQRIYTRGGPGGPIRGGQRQYSPQQALMYGGEHTMNNGTNENGNNGLEQEASGDDTIFSDVLGNRGHAFLHFPTHLHALEAKKSTTPGLIGLWGRDLKVVWANNERGADMSKETKTLFVRNVGMEVNNRDIIELLVKFVPRTSIRKISKVRTTAFLDFTTREAAEISLQNLQGSTLRDQCLDIEWAKPSQQQSLHRMRNTDFDAVLRLKCLANGWQIPIIIFGTHYEAEGVQYCAVVLRDGKKSARAIFCVLQSHELCDIHSRLCEVVCVLVETIGTFPDYNYLFFVQRDHAHLLGMVTHNLQRVEFIPSNGVPSHFQLDFHEIIDLSFAVASVVVVPEERLLHAYLQSFNKNSMCTYLSPQLFGQQQRLFGTIMPKYRNKPPLKYNLNDTQIVLALCYSATGMNAPLPARPYVGYAMTTFDNGYESLRYVTLELLPISLTQSRFVVNHMLSAIQFGGSSPYYHPAHRMMYPAFWLTGCTYTTSVKHPLPGTISPLYGNTNCTACAEARKLRLEHSMQSNGIELSPPQQQHQQRNSQATVGCMVPKSN